MTAVWDILYRPYAVWTTCPSIIEIQVAGFNKSNYTDCVFANDI